MKNILKISSKDGTFVRSGIRFPPAPDFVKINGDDLDCTLIETLLNEDALIVEEVQGDTNDNPKPTGKEPEPTVKELKSLRGDLLAEITKLASAEDLDRLEISAYAKGKNKSDVEDDIASLKQILSEVKDDKGTDTNVNKEPSNADNKE